MGTKLQIFLASCLFIASILLISGCERSNRILVRHPIERNSDSVTIAELHYIRGGRLFLLPYVKWLESSSTLGEGGRERYEESLDLIHSRVSSVDGLDIHWNLYGSEGLHIDIESHDEVSGILDSASRFMDNFGLMPDGSAIVDIVLVKEGVGISSRDRFYYISQPHFRFYFPLNNGGSNALNDSLYSAIFTVIHEMVHYREMSGGVYDDTADYADIREEVGAYAASECGKIWMAKYSNEFEVVVKKRHLPNAVMLREGYEIYGPSVSGQILANRLVFSIYPESKSVVVPRSDFSLLLSNCMRIINMGPAVEVSPVGARLH